MDQSMQTYMKNIEAKTGKTVEALCAELRASGLAKHAELRTLAQERFGLTYGYANYLAMEARGGLERGSEDDAVASQYAGTKAALLPIYQAISAAVRGFGEDVELSPKKDYVSLRRKKQFGCVQPSTATRIDVGLNLKGAAPDGRLEASKNAMFTHCVRVTAVDQVDAELVSLLRRAYDLAG